MWRIIITVGIINTLLYSIRNIIFTRTIIFIIIAAGSNLYFTTIMPFMSTITINFWIILIINPDPLATPYSSTSPFKHPYKFVQLHNIIPLYILGKQ